VNLNTVLSSSPSGGIWSGAGVTHPTFTPSIAGVGVHTVTYTFGAGTCLTTVTSAITVNPQPTISSNNATICIGQSATLNATGAGAAGSYNWTASPTLSCTNCQSTIATPLSTTTYTVTGTTNLGCSNSATPLVTVNPLPAVNAGVDTTLCNQPIPVQMIGTIIGGTWTGPSINPTGLFTPSGTGTYSVTYTVVLATGCSNSDVKIITVISPTLSNAGIDQTICVGNPSIAITGSPAGGSWSGPGITPLGLFTPSSSGVFGLIYSIGFGNCLTRDTMNFTVNALPIISAGPDRQFCISDNSDSFIGNPSGGTWSGIGITNSFTGTFDPTLAGVGVHPIVYTYSDPLTSCLNRDTLLSTVHPLPSVSFNYNPIICQGVAETFTNTSTFVASSHWDFGNGFTSSNLSETYTYTVPGFYDIQLIVTSPFGCVDSLTQSVEVRTAPFADFSIAIDSACGPFVTTFNNLSSGSGLTYNWQLGNGQTSSSFNPGTQSYAAASGIDTTYYVQLSVTNNCGSSSYLDSIIVMPQPIAFFGTNVNSGCSPLALSIANLSSGLPDSYFWDFGNGITSTSSANLIQETFITGSTPTVYTISLVVQNECGLDSISHIITVLPNTVTAFFNSSITSGCENLTVDFTQYSIGGTIYNWDFGDNNTSTQLNPTHTFMNPGNYDVSLVINDGCAFDTMVTTIVVNPAPLVGFSVAPDSVCINEPFNFTNSSLNLANSSWTFGDGGSSSLTNPQYAYSQPGNYSVTLVGTSLANGCVDSVSQIVHVSQNTLSSFTVNATSGCAPFNVQFTNLSTNAAYQSWNPGDGNSSTSINPNHIFTAAGTYQVELITESASGCSDTSVVMITVHPLPVSDFSFVSTNTCYSPVDVIITNNSTGAFNYYWDFGNGQTSSSTNTTVTYNNPGTYIISLVAENMYGCQSENQQTIIVYPTPVAQFQLLETVACANDPLVFQSNNINVDEVLWIMGDGSELMGDTVTYAYTIPGNYFVTMIVFGAGGCGDTLISNTSITINPDPVANFEYVNVQVPDPLNGTVEFTNLSQGASNYVWFFSNDSTSTAIDPVFQFRNYGTYNTTLVAINEFGCTDTIAMDVVVDFFNGLFLPNAIYPGSGIFEISHFIPKGVGLKEFELQIYDDWGNLIWQTTALDMDGRPSEFWDGTFNGVPVQQDAYVWKVKAVFLDNAIWEGNDMKMNKIKRSGTVTVIR
jgi:PKD repeat protein